MLAISDDVMEIIERYKNEYFYSECALAGHNGPYCVLENDYRNTAHWTVSFCIMYEITKEETYLQIAKRFAEHLHTAVCATKRGAIETMQGHINLVAVAWIVEALIKAGKCLDNETYYEDAEYIWKSQQYDKRLHLWNMINDENEVLGKDVAFNHNLWFAMAGIKIYQATGKVEYRDLIEDFLNHCNSHYMVYRNGRISHFIINSGSKKFDLINKVRKGCIEISQSGTPWNKSNQAEYERAYHLFSLYAFAQIYEFMPELKIFRSSKFVKVKKYALNIENFIEFDEKSNYAYGYNSPYFEFPFVEYMFTKNQQLVAEHMKILRQRQTAYDSSGQSKTDDPITLDARVYELMQMYEMMLKESETSG